MAKYKALVHYHFKKGQEEKAFKLLQNELNKLPSIQGCSGMELLHNEKDPSRAVGITIWESIDDARDFQTLWNETEKEITLFCDERPHHQFFKITTVQLGKGKKAA